MKRASIATLAVIALFLAACSNSKDNAAPTTGTSTTPAATTPATDTPSTTGTALASPFNDHGSTSVSGMTSFELEMDDFYFKPSILKGTPGQSLKLELKNEGTAEHNFTLAAQNLDKDVEKGKSEDITIAFPASGTLEFFCKYHVAGGMKGAITV